MKVELKEAKVELEVKNGKSKLYINGHCVELPKVVGIKLIFGDDIGIEFPDPPKVVKRGCQSPASKKKLSSSLKKYYAKQRRKRNATTKAKVETLPTKPIVVSKPPIKKAVPKHLNGKSYLNGHSPHP